MESVVVGSAGGIFLTKCNRLTSISRVACRQLRTLCRHFGMSSTSSNAEAEVCLETKNKIAVITLNRPKALNALNLNMIRQIYPALQKWEVDSEVGLILMKGAGDRAFCAGGDVRAVAEAGLKGEDLTKDFFREEYMLNHAIGTLKTPYVAFIDGITMGGGVGLSIHGRFRVATERTVFAMPETAIGLFPDVGGGHALPRMRGKLGLFLALTGYRLKAYDVKHAGVATHFVTSEKLVELESALLKLRNPHLDNVQELLEYYDKMCSEGQSGFVLEKYTEQINRCFSKPTMEEIITALKEDGSEWARKQLEMLYKMSPLSMKVTLRQLQEGEKRNLKDCLKMEYRLTQRFMEDKDFYEGIRAVLIDKDNNPKWNPSTLDAISKEKVDSYFGPLGDRELVL